MKLFLSALLLFQLSGFLQAQNAQPSQSTSRPQWWTLDRYLQFLPTVLEQIETSFRRWSRLDPSMVKAEEEVRSKESLVKALYTNDRFIAAVFSSIPDTLGSYHHILEFYDDRVQNRLIWFILFLQSNEWHHLEQAVPDSVRKKLVGFSGLDSLITLRRQEVEFYQKLRHEIEAIPAVFRRPFHDRGKRFDEPAVPEGGYAALQAEFGHRISSLGDSLRALIIVKALIAEDGTVLRTQIIRSSGVQAIDRQAVTAIERMRWRAASYKGRPFKTETSIALRVWGIR